MGSPPFCTITESGQQYPFTPIFLFYGIFKCVTGIFSQVIIHEYIRDYIIIDIILSSFHDLSELSFCDPICVFHLLGFEAFLCHNIYGVFFIPNVLDIHIIFLNISLRKWWRMLMYLVQITTWILFARKIAPWLYSCKFSGFWTLDISCRSILKNFTSCTYDKSATYSYSVHIIMIVLWVFEKHGSSVTTSVATITLPLSLVSLFAD